MLVAPTDEVPGPLVAPVLLGARVVGAPGRGVELLAELRLFRVTRVLRLLLLLLLALLGRGLDPAPARGLPAQLLQVLEQVPLDILPDPGLLGDLLAPRVRVNTWGKRKLSNISKFDWNNLTHRRGQFHAFLCHSGKSSELLSLPRR